MLLLLFCVGVIAGVINSIAGGGSFLSFPALLFAGVPPIAANATNTFASTAGYISGTVGFLQDIKPHKSALILISAFSVIGGLIGAYVLLQTPETSFEQLIPWLMLFATLLFIFGAQLNRTLRKLGGQNKRAGVLGQIGLKIFLFFACVYGGFFNAGQGIINLAYLSLAGHTNINFMNGIKLFMSAIVGLFAIGVFEYVGAIAWKEGIAVMLGTLVGGYASARVSRLLPQQIVRNVVIAASILTTAYFFYATYFA